jgi:hypothetical protein
MCSAGVRNAVAVAVAIGAAVMTGPVAARANPNPAPVAMNRPPDFVLITKKCVQISSRLGGHKAPLQVEHPKRGRESCWRSGADIACNAGDAPINLRVNRELGPKLFATGEGGLMMLSLDWATASFADGITYFTEEIGISHVQCTGTLLSGEAAQADGARARGRKPAKGPQLE